MKKPLISWEEWIEIKRKAKEIWENRKKDGDGDG